MTTSYRERFQILEEIGEGGFARVYKARELHTGRKAALKVLKDAYLKDSEIVERFRREVFAVASISSPHVVGMFDFGISGDEVFIAMEFVEGPTLRDIIYDRAWSASEVHLLIGQIAQALSAAHRQNIVHRDLKPENVMLVPGAGGTRVVKVLDFGLAKLAELERKLELEPLTRAGMCFGTPQYMAPELIQGKPYDKSIDLYALGVIAFEMFSGVLPWDGADPRQVLLSVVKKPPPHLTSAQHSSITRIAELDAFVQRALSKDTTKRPASAEVFFREFEIALFGKEQPRKATGVPAAEAAFGSIWAVPLDLKANEDATEIDAHAGRVRTPVELLPVDPVSASGVRKRRLHSGWIKSMPDTETIDVDENAITDQNLKKVSVQEKIASTPAPIPLTKPKRTIRAPHTEATSVVKNPSHQKRLILWLLPLLIGLVVFAAALGYFLGQKAGR